MMCPVRGQPLKGLLDHWGGGYVGCFIIWCGGVFSSSVLFMVFMVFFLFHSSAQHTSEFTDRRNSLRQLVPSRREFWVIRSKDEWFCQEAQFPTQTRHSGVLGCVYRGGGGWGGWGGGSYNWRQGYYTIYLTTMNKCRAWIAGCIFFSLPLSFLTRALADALAKIQRCECEERVPWRVGKGVDTATEKKISKLRFKH